MLRLFSFSFMYVSTFLHGDICLPPYIVACMCIYTMISHIVKIQAIWQVYKYFSKPELVFILSFSPNTVTRQFKIKNTHCMKLAKYNGDPKVFHICE